MKRTMVITAVILAGVALLLMASCSSLERKLLFFPTHRPPDGGLTPWLRDGSPIGCARVVAAPKNVWLMIHGNGGQAIDRAYAIPCFSPDDSVFILEYPGYGNRAGKPGKTAFNQAAKEAYLELRRAFPGRPVCVVGESIGSGPASTLTSLDPPPDKLVLVVPFDQLALVAKAHFPSWLVGLMFTNDWDNVAALRNYRGPVEIFGAESDEIIPVAHAKALAAGVPGAKFTLIEGGHNEWSHTNRVRIRNP
jgi:pimeloyl-ACP methyl ester carboxylesterase